MKGIEGYRGRSYASGIIILHIIHFIHHGEHCKNFIQLCTFLTMFITLEEKIIYLKAYDIHGTYLSVQMKRKQMQIVKIMN